MKEVRHLNIYNILFPPETEYVGWVQFATLNKGDAACLRRGSSPRVCLLYRVVADGAGFEMVVEIAGDHINACIGIVGRCQNPGVLVGMCRRYRISASTSPRVRRGGVCVGKCMGNSKYKRL